VNGAIFHSRSTAGAAATSTNVTGVWNPYWVRLTRSGDVFTAERSPDGATWVQVGSPQAIAMNQTLSIGLAVTASDNNQLDIATFDNVAVVASNAVVIEGTSGADSIRLVRNGATTEVWLNGSIVRTFVPATASDVSIDALDGDDTITLDFSGGSPVPIVSNIDGNAGNDMIATIGSASADMITFLNGLLSVAGVNVSHTNIESRTLDGLRGGDNVTIGDGMVRVTATQALASLTILSGATLDLDNHDLILDYAGESSPLAGVADHIRTARNGGTWTGAGITSSAARTNPLHNTTLGAIESADFKSIYGDAATFAGQAIDATAVLIKYTYSGDADFNGQVNFDDYSRTDAGFNNSRSGWLNGDFDFNGIVNFDDYSLIDLAFNTQSAPLRDNPLPKPTRLPRSR
jgi:hypothetical protein